MNSEPAKTIDPLSANNKVLELLARIDKRTENTDNNLNEYMKKNDKEVNEIKLNVATHERQISELVDTVKQLRETLIKIGNPEEKQKQFAIRKNIAITGIPIVNDEPKEIVKVVNKVFEAIGAKLEKNSVQSTYCTSGLNGQKRIIVRLKYLTTKLMILNAAKTKGRLQLSDIGISTGDGNGVIYINNHITPYFALLLAKAKEAVRSGLLHSCWFSLSTVHVKVKEGGDRISINSREELDHICTINSYNSEDRGSESIVELHSTDDSFASTSSKSHKKTDRKKKKKRKSAEEAKRRRNSSGSDLSGDSAKKLRPASKSQRSQTNARNRNAKQ